MTDNLNDSSRKFFGSPRSIKNYIAILAHTLVVGDASEALQRGGKVVCSEVVKIGQEVI